MGHVTGTPFGIGTPALHPAAQSFVSVSPYAGQAPGISAFAPYGGALPSVPLQQIAQLLQIVPQQLQQLQVLQQQQLQQLQQLLYAVPAQLQLLQQLLQATPFQMPQIQPQGQPFSAAVQSPFAFGIVPPTAGGQAPTYVM